MKDRNRRPAAKWLTSVSLITSLCAGLVPTSVVTAQNHRIRVVNMSLGTAAIR